MMEIQRKNNMPVATILPPPPPLPHLPIMYTRPTVDLIQRDKSGRSLQTEEAPTWHGFAMWGWFKPLAPRSQPQIMSPLLTQPWLCHWYFQSSRLSNHKTSLIVLNIVPKTFRYPAFIAQIGLCQHIACICDRFSYLELIQHICDGL